MTPADHWERAKDWLPAAFGFAALPNLIDAVADIDGWAWLAVDTTTSAVFTLVLVYWIVSFVCQRRMRHAA